MQGSMISSRMAKRASLVISRASLMISWERPIVLQSIWMAVMPFLVPATLEVHLAVEVLPTPWMSMKVVKPPLSS